MNSNGEILCHQRSLNKERMPGVWSTHFGGHVTQGETYESNAQKELSEEIGVHIPLQKFLAWRTTKIDKACLWAKEFTVLLNKDVSEMVQQESEVSQLKWISPQEILKLSENNPEMWCAGTHDFLVEYHCLRAVLSVAQSFGMIETEPQINVWGQLKLIS